LIERRALWPDVEAEAAKIAGTFGLMIIAAINQGQLTSLSGIRKSAGSISSAIPSSPRGF
jgi:hypothetical protein